MPVDRTKRISGFNFEISVSGHAFNSDVSEKLGGGNLGPDPHDLLQAALAACTAITMQMFAERKKIPLISSDVKVRITQEGNENRILREIKLEGDLTDEQSKLLLSIAEKCPVHRFLARGSQIETHLIQ